MLNEEAEAEAAQAAPTAAAVLMSADVINFPTASNDDEDGGGPHLSGQAICGACQHEWEAVAPVGTCHLECPKCARMWGAFKHVVEPELAWQCDCGERLFWLTSTGAMCRRCGVRSNDWAN